MLLATVSCGTITAIAMLELYKAWQAAVRDNERYACRVTGDAWHNANK